MAELRLTHKAVEDLSSIWDYTYETWSENQADKYYEMLILICKEIANDPHLGKNYDEIKHDLFWVQNQPTPYFLSGFK